MRDIGFNGVIYGTTAVCIDAGNLFGNISLKKINIKIRTGAWETHELCWRKYLVEVRKSYDMSVPGFIQQTKLQKYSNNNLFVNVVYRIKSAKQAL